MWQNAVVSSMGSSGNSASWINPEIQISHTVHVLFASLKPGFLTLTPSTLRVFIYCPIAARWCETSYICSSWFTGLSSSTIIRWSEKHSRITGAALKWIYVGFGFQRLTLAALGSMHMLGTCSPEAEVQKLLGFLWAMGPENLTISLLQLLT